VGNPRPAKGDAQQRYKNSRQEDLCKGSVPRFVVIQFTVPLMSPWKCQQNAEADTPARNIP
jgi:hypothetical protein